MFSRANADTLREGLAPIDFNDVAAVDPSVQNLVKNYCTHYGLDFEHSLSIQHHIGLVQSGSYTVVCQYFTSTASNGESKGTIFLLHGYFDHSGIYRHLIRHCLQLGFCVVIFDFPGHGLSSGTVASIESFREYNKVFFDCLSVAQSQGLATPWIAIGQSTGGAIIVDSILDSKLADKFSFEKYLLLAPLLRPKHWYRSKLLFSISRWFWPTSPRKFSINSHDKDFLQFLAKKDSLQSKVLSGSWVLAMIDYQKRFDEARCSGEKLHIIQGTGDGTVDWKFNVPQFMKKFPNSKLYVIDDARHQLVNESTKYRDKVFSQIDQIMSRAD
ncbi:MAG: hydrolase [SAR86 cluster bacterium]|uniref:Hydrolase n=1 Tax=SAR86 cluster bacterium TaxID=2030880 RepID=A0A2A5B9I2_9GAMM|nr:MAG: hydrolase [SAR86 cluster bacterium]